MAVPSSFPSLTVAGTVRRLALVLGDQLDARHPPLSTLDRDQDAVLLVEAAGESTHVPSHRQRTVLFLSAMRHFSLALVEKGYRVHHVSLDSPEGSGTLRDGIERAITAISPDEFHITEPGEWRVRAMLEEVSDGLSVPTVVHPDRHFLTTTEEFSTWATGRKTLVMEHFYRWQRKRLGILLDEDGAPVGGQWNFDAENRKSFREAPEIRPPYRARPDAITEEVIAHVAEHLPDLPGRLEQFHWPVTRAEARRALDDFIEHRLPSFGTYQDAMWSGETTLFHSRLAAAMNLKLLDPHDVIDPAIAAFERGDAPLASVEGFVRQVIGWREFIRGVYWHEGAGYRDRNALEHHGELPSFYWDGQTDLECLRQAIGQVLDEGYGHHIQRLMVTGNFALLAGVDPRQVSDWYLGMYTDAVDWVTLPNTLGMAMHADGGVVGTKPYAASGKYIQRMSDHCRHCRYAVSERTGEDACPLNTLYWDFLARHRARFEKNHRMRMTVKNLDRFSDEEHAAIATGAQELRRRFGVEKD